MKMNIFRVVLAGACTILVCAAGVGRTDPSLLATAVDEWFDSYGDISWEDEKAHLDNFAIALQRDPNTIGYIIVYAGRRAVRVNPKTALCVRRSIWWKRAAYLRVESNGLTGDIERS